MIEKGGFKVTDSELKVLMERYDKDGDGMISCSEFTNEIIPHSPSK